MINQPISSNKMLQCRIAFKDIFKNAFLISRLNLSPVLIQLLASLLTKLKIFFLKFLFIHSYKSMSMPHLVFSFC